jgi:NitT/TauT family transport system ATP-binding protein
MTPVLGPITAPGTLVAVDHLKHVYERGLVLEDISLKLREGEIVGLLGRSGCGKSTLLRIIAGLMPASGGAVFLDGRPVRGPAEGVAMVFQSFALFPWLTVLENVELGLEAQRIAPEERRKRALAAINLIGLDGFENAYPKELSGGMRQRVGLARALVVHPKILLMDEPFSALDVLTADTLRTDLLDLWMEGRMPTRSILIVTHNIEEAVFMCDRILVLSSNPGRLVAEIAVKLPHPRNRVDPAFRSLVDDIYTRMTAKPATLAKEGVFPGMGTAMVLHRVSSNALSGLMETLAAPPFDGKADLPVLADQLHMEVDDLFPIAEMLQLLRFAELFSGDIRLTQAGRRFVDADTDTRKVLFGKQVVAHVPLAAQIKRILDERPIHRAPMLRFKDELEDHMSEEQAEQTLRAVISLARFGEVFAYDEPSQMFSLENPA